MLQSNMIQHVSGNLNRANGASLKYVSHQLKKKKKQEKRKENLHHRSELHQIRFVTTLSQSKTSISIVVLKTETSKYYKYLHSCTED